MSSKLGAPGGGANLTVDAASVGVDVERVLFSNEFV